MHPTVKSLLLLAKRLAPIPGFLAAFGVWGFVFNRYSEPPIDLAGRALAASVAAAASASAANGNAAAPGRSEEDGAKHVFSPYDACLQQQSLFPGQYGSLECNQEELPASFAWTWAPPPGKEKPATPRPRSSAAEPAPEAPDPGE